MSAEPKVSQETIAFPPIVYSPSRAAIAELKSKYSSLVVTGPEDMEGYEQVKIALRDVVKTRTGIEAYRKKLKDPSIVFGREVDSQAKDLQALLAPIERHLDAQKAIVDDERERKVQELIAKQKAEEEAKIAAERAAEEAKRQAERDAIRKEQLALAEERRKLAEAQIMAATEARKEAERVRAEQAEERRKFDQQQAIQLAEAAVERNKLLAQQRELQEQQRKVEAERQTIERARFENEAKARAEKEARERAADEARIAEQRKKIAEAEAREEAEHQAAAAPDIDKLRFLAQNLSMLQCPAVKSDEARATLERAFRDLGVIISYLEAWKPAKKARKQPVA